MSICVTAFNAAMEPCIGGTLDDHLSGSIFLSEQVPVDTEFRIDVEYISGTLFGNCSGPKEITSIFLTVNSGESFAIASCYQFINANGATICNVELIDSPYPLCGTTTTSSTTTQPVEPPLIETLSFNLNSSFNGVGTYYIYNSPSCQTDLILSGTTNIVNNTSNIVITDSIEYNQNISIKFIDSKGCDVCGDFEITPTTTTTTTTSTTTTLINTFTNGSDIGTLIVSSGSGYNIFLSGSPFTMSPNPTTTSPATISMNGSNALSTISFTLGGTTNATAFSNMVITDGVNNYNAIVSGGGGTGPIVISFNIGTQLGRTFTWLTSANNEVNIQF